MVEKIYVSKFLSDGTLDEDNIVCLPLRSYDETNIAVTNIDGLAPMPGTINMDDNAGADGSIFNSARAQNRSIVLTLKQFESDAYDFDRNYISKTMEATRRKIYMLFPLKKKVRLTFETDTRTYYIDGFVETINSDYFGDLEGTQVTVLCPDPYFKIEWPNGGFSLIKSGIPYEIDMSPNDQSHFYGLDHNIPMIITVYIKKNVNYIADDGSKVIFSIGRGLSLDTMEYMDISNVNVQNGDKFVINTKTRTVDWIGQRNAEIIYRNGLPFISFNTVSPIDYFEYYIPGKNPYVDRIGNHRLLFNDWFTIDKDVPTQFLFLADSADYIENINETWNLNTYYEKTTEMDQTTGETKIIYVLLDAKPEGWDDPESDEYYTNYYIREQFADVVIKPLLEYEGV